VEDISFDYYRNLAGRRRRRRRVLAIVPAVAAVALSLGAVWYPNLLEALNIKLSFAAALSMAFLIVSMLSMVMTYLQTGFGRKIDEEAMDILLRRRASKAEEKESEEMSMSGESAALTSEVASLKAEVEKLSDNIAGIDESKKLELVNLVTSQIRQAAVEDLWGDLQQKVQVATAEAARSSDISKQFEEARTRLAQEVSALGRRGNLNLSLGVVTTIVGLILLSYFVLSSGDAPKQPIDFALHSFPRLTLVIFIEVFAYFFLRLYKSGLSEIKYFQNEVTNMEAKYIALKTALNVGDEKIIGDVIAQFGNTERNHILEKGQTTVEIEKTRIDKEALGETLKNLSAIFSKK
jgi:hypothetical protein